MGYKINMTELEDKLKYIKPDSLSQAISEKFRKSNFFKKLNENEEIQENTNDFENKTRLVEEAYANKLNFMNNIYSKIAKANNKIEKQKEIINESFNENVFVFKAERDLMFFKELIESTFENMPKVKEELYNSFKEVLVEAIELYKETNTKPRFINTNLFRKDLTENEIINVYKRHFKAFLEENYIKKLKANNIEENEIKEIKDFTKILLENNFKVDLDEIMIYYPFEKALKEFFESIIIPDLAKRKIEIFMENQAPEYYEIFDRNAKIIYESLEEKISKIVSMIAPFLFKDTIDADLEKPEKYAGISMVCKKVNDGPMVCEVKKEDNNIEDELKDDEAAVEAAAEAEAEMIDDFAGTSDEDKDHDGKPDAEEDHGELPEDFKGDHKDAEEQKKEETSISTNEDKDHDGKPDAEEPHGELPEDFEGDHKDAMKYAEKKKEEKKKANVEETAMTTATQALVTAEETRKELGIKNDKNTNDSELLKKANKEEIIPDEADGIKDLKDAAKEEK